MIELSEMEKTGTRKDVTEELATPNQNCVKKLPPHLEKLPPHLDKKLGELVKEIEGVR